MQDASAQMTILQFNLCGRKDTAVPASIHCDHLIVGQKGASEDLKKSIETESEVYNFLHSACRKYGIDFWKPGSGIIHQSVLENYAFPGGLMLGTDSHTPNAGGLGMIAIGVGGADAVDALAGFPWELKFPKVLGVKLTGTLNGWVAPKDVILKLAGILSVRGGTGYVVEYFGEGVESLSCTGMATICNMGAEVGATSSVFPFTESMRRYLQLTRRSDLAELASANKSYLKADPGARYDKLIEINLSELEPRLNGPDTPDASNSVSMMKEVSEKLKYPKEVQAALIGSCTNSSYYDLSRAASLVRQAREKNLKPKVDFFLSPGSEQIRATVERDGIMNDFESAGVKVLANACGPCIGQWDRGKEVKEKNVIVSSFNRNFKGRNDGNPNTLNFLASPEIVTAIAFGGRLDFNPVTDSIELENGENFRFKAPHGDDLPPKGFIQGREEYQPLVYKSDASQTIDIDPNSTRLQVLHPFEAWNGKEFEDLLVLVKVKGKCTTDHISAAGPWLKYKGHLENIAKNTLIGALNADNNKVNCVKNQLSPEETEGTIPDVAEIYKNQGKKWMVIADYNYGEGSAREHAALQPRYLNCSMILAKSFARIHETNLKKQGILPLTFNDPNDYSKIPATGASVSTVGLTDLLNGKSNEIKLIVKTASGQFDIPVSHTLSADQISWIKYGSALNMIRNAQ
jgi:aconitate hydratase